MYCSTYKIKWCYMQTINADRLKKAIVLTHSLIFFFVDRAPLFLNQNFNKWWDWNQLVNNWSIMIKRIQRMINVSGGSRNFRTGGDNIYRSLYFKTSELTTVKFKHKRRYINHCFEMYSFAFLWRVLTMLGWKEMKC